MKKHMLLWFVIASSYLPLFAKEPLLLFTAPVRGYMQLFKVDKRSYCIADSVIYLVSKKGLVQQAVIQTGCNDAVADRNNIVLATNNGLMLFDTKTNSITTLLPETIKGNISHVQVDGNHHLWFTKAFEGCYTIDDSNKVAQRVKVPVAYDLAYTIDGNMWVGTNVGLYKVPVSGDEITHYAEEGIASNELPDNLVERLFADEQSNVWAIMPGHITLIAAGSEEEFPDYEQIGNRDNELYDITTAMSNTYLFATAQGVLLMHDLKHGEALFTGEIHQTINENAYLLSDELMEKPAPLKHAEVRKIKACGNKTFFITNHGLWSVDTIKFINRLKQKGKGHSDT